MRFLIQRDHIKALGPQAHQPYWHGQPSLRAIPYDKVTRANLVYRF